MDESFQFLMSEYGPFTDSTALSAESAAVMRKDFPEEFVGFLEEAGLGVWQSGRFQFCDPLGMTGVVELIFDGDRDFYPDRTFIYGYGATGILFAWNSEWKQTVTINLPELEASSLLRRNKRSRNTKKKKSYIERTDEWQIKETIVSSVLYLDGEYYDLTDPKTGKPVLAKFLKKHGALSCGEVYGYFPALALGGSGALDTLKRVQAVEHFTLLAQLDSIQFRYIHDGDVRPLGKP